MSQGPGCFFMYGIFLLKRSFHLLSFRRFYGLFPELLFDSLVELVSALCSLQWEACALKEAEQGGQVSTHYALKDNLLFQALSMDSFSSGPSSRDTVTISYYPHSSSILKGLLRADPSYAQAPHRGPWNPLLGSCWKRPFLPHGAMAMFPDLAHWPPFSSPLSSAGLIISPSHSYIKPSSWIIYQNLTSSKEAFSSPHFMCFYSSTRQEV